MLIDNNLLKALYVQNLITKIHFKISSINDNSNNKKKTVYKITGKINYRRKEFLLRHYLTVQFACI